ncbi:MAG TPA: serine/threonine-protein kinase [Polyangia bacterium]|nr:serine/threonine-protein kinase [Polyangia bacterium]
MAQDTELRGHVLGGKYRLVRQVSDGPRRVYEVRHERLAGRFAAKLWPATTPWDAFREGAQLAATLRHPGVMQVLDFNCEPGAAPFLVYEWVDGARLTDILAESGILPVERVAPLVESAAWALASAHQQGVVHQELRPDEVFVVHAPGTMREWVKLAGFGVSAALARAGTVPPSRYRAPEQRGDGAAGDDDGDDPQSDQYSLAAIAYELLAGVPPFDEERSRAEPLPISDLAPGVSPGVDAAIRQALATNPEERFAGVLEFARALRAAVDGATPEAVRRRAEARAERGKSGDKKGGAEPVSPFFNPLQPLQARASEAFRRVASSTAKLRTLASARLRGGALPARPQLRAALAGGVLLLAFAGVAALVKHRPERQAATKLSTEPSEAATPPEAAAAPAPPANAQTTNARAPATAKPSAQNEAPAATDAAAPGDDDDAAKTPSAAAWARLAAGNGRAGAPRDGATKGPPRSSTRAAKPKIAGKKIASAVAVRPSAATAKPPTTTAKTAQPAAGACVLSVGSRPPADVWIDERSLGRRTPLIKYKLACGDHKLALKRADLDLYQMEVVTLRAGAPFKKVYPLQ